jgi:dTDP-4-dehydrorhamnose reductase
VLLLGATGQVGGELIAILSPDVEVIAPSSREVDLARPDTLRAAVERTRPWAIVNAAAYTEVDQAESEPERARLINAVGPGILAEEAARHGALLMHYSTDYVYDGTSHEPYREDARTAPLNVYGRTKLEGDEAVQRSGCRHVILRTGWIYSLRGRNFLLTMLRLFRERDEVAVVDDQIGAPTSARYVAEATRRVLERDPHHVHSGVYHVSPTGRTSWFGFAGAILRSPAAAGTRCQRLKPIRSREYGAPAVRPLWSVLDSTRFERSFAFPLRSWQELLEETIASVAPSAGAS